MKYLYQQLAIVIVLVAATFSCFAAQGTENDTTNIISKFDEISYKWDAVAEDLEKYQGLGSFCLQRDYRTRVIQLLEEVHHFDSLVYDKLKKISAYKESGEIRKTVKQIEELESEFSIKEFTSFLNKECRDRKAIEKTRDDLKANIGQDGYDGQQKLLEGTLYRYIRHVTYLVDHIRKHIHHLHIDD